MRLLSCLTPITVVALMPLALAPAMAATPGESRFIELKGSLGSYDVKCESVPVSGTPYTITDAGDGMVRGATATTVALREKAGAKRVAANFTGRGTVKSAKVKAWDGSLSGSTTIAGEAISDAKIGGSCRGYGGVKFYTSQVIHVPRAATFTLTGEAETFQYASLRAGFASSSVDFPDPFLNLNESGFTSDGKYPKPFNATKTVRVPAGSYITMEFSAFIAASNSWSSSQLPGQAPVYSVINTNQSGTAKLSYKLLLDPMPGQQVKPTATSVAKIVKLPVNLNCGSRKFTFGVKKPSSFKKAVIYANGKKVKTLKRVKKTNTVKFSKAKPTKVKIVFKTKKNRTKPIVKNYVAC